MKVIVYADRPGWHRYPDHLKLGTLHRHVFKVWAIYDENTSRELEFFDAQEDLKFELGSLPLEWLNNSTMSCEDIARVLLEMLECSACIVSEDGENSVYVDCSDISS